VEIRTEAQVKKIIKRGNQIEKIILADGQELRAKNYILATGGLSYPETGSTGDGYRWLKDLGHTVVAPRPALTPIELKDKMVAELEGLSLRAVKISVVFNDKKRVDQIGDVVFTADGLSGPLVFDLSRSIGELLPGEVTLRIDFLPELTEEALDEKLQNLFKTNSNKQIQNSLTELIAPKLLPIFLRLSGVMAEKKNNEITRAERRRLIVSFKTFKLTVKKLKGFDRATITAGGVALREIDPKTMQSRSIINLFVVGEVLDVDGPTGGFNLQEAFSTGYAAGETVALKFR
jgi:predicted Rossmann fold flavoprotein